MTAIIETPPEDRYITKRRSRSDWIKDTASWAPTQRPGEALQVATLPRRPLEPLLTYDESSLPEAGASATEYLRAGTATRSELDWLATHARQGMYSGRPIAEHNLVAAADVLTSHNHPDAFALIEERLAAAPNAYQLFVVPLARHPSFGLHPGAGRLAGRVVELLDRCTDLKPDPEWHRRFVVEAFRTVAFLSPSACLGRLSPHLKRIEDLELTAVLEATCEAARRVAEADPAFETLRDAADAILGRILRDGLRDVGNTPGIAGRLFELLGRSGVHASDLIQRLDGHPLRTRILYQFARRPLDFLRPSQRLILYGTVLDGLAESGSDDPLIRFISEVILRDSSAPVRRIIHHVVGKIRDRD